MDPGVEDPGVASIHSECQFKFNSILTHNVFLKKKKNTLKKYIVQGKIEGKWHLGQLFSDF